MLKIYLRDLDTRIILEWSKDLERLVYILEKRKPIHRGLAKEWKQVATWAPDFQNEPPDWVIEDELNRIALDNLDAIKSSNSYNTY